MSGGKPEYDMQKRTRAGTAAALRAAGALYILYLGYSILRGYLEGTSTLPAWVAWLAGVVFICAPLAFGVYIVRRYKADLAAARIEPEGEEKS